MKRGNEPTKHLLYNTQQADALGSKIGYAKYVVTPNELVKRFSSVSTWSNINDILWHLFRPPDFI